MSEKITYQSTVIFADVAGSSRLYKKVGDREANRMILELLDHIAEIVRQHDGVVIKTIGDEIMAHIVNADKAHSAVVGMQQYAQQSLPIRIGMAWGTVIEMDADLYGHTVNDAAAVAHIARGGQIITTSAFKDQLDEDRAAMMRVFDRIRLKGGRTLTDIYRLEWTSQDEDNDSEHTMLGETVISRQEVLKLTYRASNGEAKRQMISPDDTPFSIGRSGSSCRLEIFKGYVSREHCEICYEHDRFILRDHSSNGTYITTDSGQTIFIRRGEFPLTSSGSFAVGRKPDAQDSYIIGFQG